MNSSPDSFLKYFQRTARLDPERDWLMLIMLGTTVLFGVIMWNVWAFNIVAEGGVIGKTTTSTAPTFNQASLDTLRSVFVNRAAEEGKYLNNGYTYVDPSL